MVSNSARNRVHASQKGVMSIMLPALFLVASCTVPSPNGNIENTQSTVTGGEVINTIKIARDWKWLENKRSGAVISVRNSDGNVVVSGINHPALAAQGNFYYISCESHSMLPTFDCNDKLILERVYSVPRITVGDIIWYETFGGKYVHRVIALNGTRYVTQGDNNPLPDDYQPRIENVKFIVRGVVYG